MTETTEIKKFARGAVPTPRHRLAAATPFQPKLTRAGLPDTVAYVPSQLSMWGNDKYGDCVTAEEAFNKAVSGHFIDEQTVINWATAHGFRDGAMLDEVMAMMARAGFSAGGHVFGDGAGPKSVDYSNEDVLKAALAIAPVKIGIDANGLPSGAGNHQGFYKFGGKPGQFSNEDHCVALCGYGTVAQLCAALGVAVPANLDPTKQAYLLYTWSTIGLVDHAAIMSMTGEAWVRDPSTTVDGAPQPNPGPGPNPTPVPVPPVPVPPTPTPVPPTPTPVTDGVSVLAAIGIGAAALAVGFGAGFLVGHVTAK